MLTEGKVVTLKVRNPNWEARDRYASGVIREFSVYTGTVMRQKWFGDNEIGLTSTEKRNPFRVIRMENIAELTALWHRMLPQLRSSLRLLSCLVLRVRSILSLRMVLSLLALVRAGRFARLVSILKE